MFLNEFAACERTDDRKYEWASRDAETKMHTLFKKFKRWFILSAYITKEYIAWRIHHESIIQNIFNDFVRNDVLSLIISTTLNDFNLMLCLNNVSAHKSEKL